MVETYFQDHIEEEIPHSYFPEWPWRVARLPLTELWNASFLPLLVELSQAVSLFLLIQLQLSVFLLPRLRLELTVFPLLLLLLAELSCILHPHPHPRLRLLRFQICTLNTYKVEKTAQQDKASNLFLSISLVSICIPQANISNLTDCFLSFVIL